jgi:hypothetical protein
MEQEHYLSKDLADDLFEAFGTERVDDPTAAFPKATSTRCFPGWLSPAYGRKSSSPDSRKPESSTAFGDDNYWLRHPNTGNKPRRDRSAQSPNLPCEKDD